MKSQPSFIELTAFMAIVRHGSFRAAADELAMSASTLNLADIPIISAGSLD